LFIDGRIFFKAIIDESCLRWCCSLWCEGMNNGIKWCW